MNIVGISCFYHESAAALIRDGKILAASAEERFSRRKHDDSFPDQAINFCLKFANIRTKDLDLVVFYEKPFIRFERSLTVSLSYFPNSLSFFVNAMKNFLVEKLWIKSIIAQKLRLDPHKILFVPHHLSHAAASFYPSPFEDAAYLTLDAVGEWTTGSWGVAKGNKLYPMAEMKFPNSVGLLYSTFTAFLGFEVNDGEYKVMGMAGYGQPKYMDKVKKLYKQYQDGSIKLNLDYFSFHRSSKAMYSTRFVREFREVGEGQARFDLAASLQKCTEEIVFNMLKFVHKQVGMDNLVYGGGVALNSVINGQITSKTPFKDVFIFPAAGDDGGAVGAALYVYHHVLGYKKRYQLEEVFLGQSGKLGRFGRLGKKMVGQKLMEYVAKKLAEGKVVGWFEGRAEFGPRALGGRSILADPRDAKMRDMVNSKIKFREEFRPFAPVVLAEYAREYFRGVGDVRVNENLAKFMLGTFKAKTKCKKFAPAIVHVDETSRAQIVHKNYPNSLRKLLKEFYEKTGVPILLNTSFNLKGEPIVNSPDDAFNTFQKSGLDILVLDNYIIEK